MTRPAPYESSSLLESITDHDFPLRHGFFSRHGGVSEGCFTSLNVGLGSSDERMHVLENRRRCAQALGAAPDMLVTLYQVHSPKVVHVTAPWQDIPVQADAMVTKTRGLMLGVLAADCMPFLFAEPMAGIIGAAHAGWRGALAGVLEATVTAMVDLGATPGNIHVSLGPCLRQPNFEVGMDLVAAFSEKYPATERFFAPGKTEEKRQLDLASFGFWRLETCGVTHIDDIAACTLANPEHYFSYRHSRQTGAADYGRNLSAIMLENHRTKA